VLISYWNVEMALPRNILMGGSILSLVAIFLCRLLFDLAMRNKIGGRRLLFIGLSPTVVQLARFFRQHPEFQLITIGYLDKPDASQPFDENVPLLGSVADLPRIIEQHRPDWMVMAKREEMQPWLLDSFIELRFGGMHTEQAASLYETTLGRVRVPEIRPDGMLFSESLQPDPLNLKLQTFYSKTLALAIILLTAPVVAITAIVMKMSARGPRLVRETRLGMRGEAFTMYRFEGAHGSKMGGLSRRLGLHVYPQLWNVLRGEMSIVGPSPDRPEFAARLNEAIPFYVQRTAVKPGVTGWAQIQAAHSGMPTDALGRLECDLYYVKNLSPSLDLSVMLRTLRDALTFENLAAA
jgi:lipopolysaccharide/colanic/teichoic acid biosynthesis glycosyltransferase